MHHAPTAKRRAALARREKVAEQRAARREKPQKVKPCRLLSMLPDDMLAVILLHVETVSDACAFAASCTRFNRISTKSSVWGRLSMVRYAYTDYSPLQLFDPYRVEELTRKEIDLSAHEYWNCRLPHCCYTRQYKPPPPDLPAPTLKWEDWKLWIRYHYTWAKDAILSPYTWKINNCIYTQANRFVWLSHTLMNFYLFTDINFTAAIAAICTLGFDILISADYHRFWGTQYAVWQLVRYGYIMAHREGEIWYQIPLLVMSAITVLQQHQIFIGVYLTRANRERLHSGKRADQMLICTLVSVLCTLPTYVTGLALLVAAYALWRLHADKIKAIRSLPDIKHAPWRLGVVFSYGINALFVFVWIWVVALVTPPIPDFAGIAVRLLSYLPRMVICALLMGSLMILAESGLGVHFDHSQYMDENMHVMDLANSKVPRLPNVTVWYYVVAWYLFCSGIWFWMNRDSLLHCADNPSRPVLLGLDKCIFENQCARI